MDCDDQQQQILNPQHVTLPPGAAVLQDPRTIQQQLHIQQQLQLQQQHQQQLQMAHYDMLQRQQQASSEMAAAATAAYHVGHVSPPGSHVAHAPGHMSPSLTPSPLLGQHPITPPQAMPGSPAAHMMAPPAAPVMTDNPYNRLCNFEIEKKIGRGQFSVVSRARCLINGQVVALKKVQVRRSLLMLLMFCLVAAHWMLAMRCAALLLYIFFQASALLVSLISATNMYMYLLTSLNLC